MLRSHAFTVRPGNIATSGPDIPARLSCPVGEELAGVLLDEIGIDDTDLVVIAREMDREVADER